MVRTSQRKNSRLRGYESDGDGITREITVKWRPKRKYLNAIIEDMEVTAVMEIDSLC